ncbi:MAG: hypothetical protein GY780_09120, partial [bacterium]|nr:hypothetical protein [bacterium]
MELSHIKKMLDRISSHCGSMGSTDYPIRLNEVEMYGIMDAMGLKSCPMEYLPVNSSPETEAKWAEAVQNLAREQGRFVLKVVGRTILHKTDVGGVRLISTENTSDADLVSMVQQMKETLEEGGLAGAIEGFMAGAFVPHKANTPGNEVLLSLRQDPAFGPCVVVGVGGTLTEWYGLGSQGKSTLILPAFGLGEDFVTQALQNHPLLSLLCSPSRLYPEPPIMVNVMVRWIMHLAQVGLEFGPAGSTEFTFEEIEINPAVAFEGHLVALDGVGLLSQRKWSDNQRPVEKINPLLKPKSAMVLGVSAKGPNPGRIILDNLKRSEGIDASRLYVVHPKEKEISGVACFPSIDAVPEKCDLAVVAVPAQGALDAITEIVAKDLAEAMILIPGGFAEAGEKDLAEAIENTLIQGHKQSNGGPVMVGGNCLGIVSRDNYNTFFLPTYKLPFNSGLGQNLAVVSQSGAYLVTFASNYDGIINPRASISFGNQMDLTISDFVEHFTTVEGVNVIACYVEGFRSGDGMRFLEMAAKAKAAGKSVIIFKAGKTALGAQAAASHTASLAGDYAVAEACLRSAGV